NQNDEEAVEKVRNAAKALNLSIIEKQEPFKWGEDFGLFTANYKGCMLGIGSGENTPALHNPDYDFPDEIIEPSALLFFNILKDLLQLEDV
ncbi:hypothetical protein RZS08_02565, partial [Arthrospira platensis SPKY1]|nr:hypothetical protein [Arthrospira platensis SPKY1]